MNSSPTFAWLLIHAHLTCYLAAECTRNDTVAATACYASLFDDETWQYMLHAFYFADVLVLRRRGIEPPRREDWQLGGLPHVERMVQIGRESVRRCTTAAVASPVAPSPDPPPSSSTVDTEELRDAVSVSAASVDVSERPAATRGGAAPEDASPSNAASAATSSQTEPPNEQADCATPTEPRPDAKARSYMRSSESDLPAEGGPTQRALPTSHELLASRPLSLAEYAAHRGKTEEAIQAEFRRAAAKRGRVGQGGATEIDCIGGVATRYGERARWSILLSPRSTAPRTP